jgi:hypothetical protein
MPSLQLRKRVPSLAPAADVKTKWKIAHKVKNAPFTLMGSSSFAVQPMKICPHALLRAFASDKYQASEWTFIIMSDAWNQVVVSGFVAR